ncbi:hypothetical protein BLX24_13505 [Arsenicibacter rosenii]|uniref:DUF1361 domain-containing protein n=2 Tax=Arsenicibacter rosenii TaxID=1750698 RepID=A0A1S2VIP5_9BACT|nr:hypothetical protein BLX24_13505 [Arsenicibacter rosenii]
MQILTLLPPRILRPIVITPVSGRGLRALLIMTIIGLGLVTMRGVLTHNWWFFYMLCWNGALAWFPLGVILVLRDLLASRALRSWMAGPFLLLWLVFLPNAPYIITDLFHIQHIQSPLLWFDTMTIFLFAVTGLLTGLYSTLLVHRLVVQRAGTLLTWLCMLGCQVLSGFGIYLGRWIRLNSWDLLTTPAMLARAVYEALHNTLSLKLTIIYGLVLAGLYIAFYLFSEDETRKKVKQA